MPYEEKYSSKVVKYYRRKHAAQLDGKHFNEEVPCKTWNEALQRAHENIISNVHKYEQKLVDMGKDIEKKIEEKGKEIGSKVGETYEKI